jgi:hypothetical protein
MAPPPLWYRGEGHTRWRERGRERPNSDEGTYTVVPYSVYVYMYFVGETLQIWLGIEPNTLQQL